MFSFLFENPLIRRKNEIELKNILFAKYESLLFSSIRCKIPECELDKDGREVGYNQTWLQFAIPYSNGRVKNCVRYAPIVGNNTKFTSGKDQCDAHMFDKSREVECSEYVYSTDEKNLQTEVQIKSRSNKELAM